MERFRSTLVDWLALAIGTTVAYAPDGATVEEVLTGWERDDDSFISVPDALGGWKRYRNIILSEDERAAVVTRANRLIEEMFAVKGER